MALCLVLGNAHDVNRRMAVLQVLYGACENVSEGPIRSRDLCRLRDSGAKGCHQCVSTNQAQVSNAWFAIGQQSISSLTTSEPCLSGSFPQLHKLKGN